MSGSRCRMLDVGNQDVGCWMSDVGDADVGCWMSDVGDPDVGCWMSDVGSSFLTSDIQHPTSRSHRPLAFTLYPFALRLVQRERDHLAERHGLALGPDRGQPGLA